MLLLPLLLMLMFFPLAVVRAEANEDDDGRDTGAALDAAAFFLGKVFFACTSYSVSEGTVVDMPLGVDDIEVIPFSELIPLA